MFLESYISQLTILLIWNIKSTFQRVLCSPQCFFSLGHMFSVCFTGSPALKFADKMLGLSLDIDIFTVAEPIFNI